MAKSAPKDKLLAEWFWTDRWMGSSGFLLPMLARGVYREMLTQAWRREARLPLDQTAIKRAIGATDAEWAEAWPLVSKYWRVGDGDYLVNDTQLLVFAESREAAEKASQRGKKGAKKRWGESLSNAQASTQALPEHMLKVCPPSPSPSPSLISGSGAVSGVNTTNGIDRGEAAALKSGKAAPSAPPVRVKIITAVAHEVLKKHNGHKVSGADLIDEIKTACAIGKVPYNASAVRKALDSAETQREQRKSQR